MHNLVQEQMALAGVDEVEVLSDAEKEKKKEQRKMDKSKSKSVTAMQLAPALVTSSRPGTSSMKVTPVGEPEALELSHDHDFQITWEEWAMLQQYRAQELVE